MKLIVNKQEWHDYQSRLMALYKEFDDAIQLLREMGRDFSEGSNGRFNNQVTVCQQLRARLVKAENIEPGAFKE